MTAPHQHTRYPARPDHHQPPNVHEPELGTGHDLSSENTATESAVTQPRRRPQAWPTPTAPARTRAARNHLLANPHVNLDDDAANTVFEGAVDTNRLRVAVELRATPTGPVSLLDNTPTSRGALYCTPPHERFVDLAILPDILNRRFGHTIATRFSGGANPLNHDFGTYRRPDPRTDGATNTPLAILHVRMTDRHRLRASIVESFRRTATVENGRNLYTDSILADGVRDPLLLFVVRVGFDDGTHDTYLMSGDGNSRLVSLWLARTGGTVEEAATAMADSVLGNPSAPPTSHTRAAKRATIEQTSTLIARGLVSPTLTEATIRAAQTQVVRAVVVVGAVDHTGNPTTDLPAAKDDIVSSVHVNTTPWATEAQNTHGMANVVRRLAETRLLIHDAARDVLEGRLHGQQLQEQMNLPTHNLWGSALAQQTLLSRSNADTVRRLVKAEFGDRHLTRAKLGGRIGSTVISSYRGTVDLERAYNTFSDGGTLTDLVCATQWQLTPGPTPRDALDAVLQQALEGNPAARAELTVLGGTAAIVDGLLTRDRGSKLVDTSRPARTAGKVPYRSTPPRVLERLASTHGGLRTLHSIALVHAEGTQQLPKLFHTRDTETETGTHHDGDPVIDAAGTQTEIQLEWDLFACADPAATEALLSDATTNQPPSQRRQVDLAATQRQKLSSGVAAALRAADQLQQLASRNGTTSVFGDYDTVHALLEHVTALERVLVRHEPQRPILTLLDNENEE